MADKNRDLGQQGKGMPGQGTQQDRSDQESGRPVQLDEKEKGQPGQGGQSSPGSGQPGAPRPAQPAQPVQPSGQPNR
jgi:hypothetical protein